MSENVDDARASYIKGIETKAGRPLGELLALVDSWGPGKHGELLAKAKEHVGLGHGHANLLVHLARERAPKKRRVSLRRSKRFAMVGPGSRGRIEIGVNYRSAAGSDRFEALGPGKMCSHRVFISAPGDIDDDLLAFVREAYEAAS